eukprot:Hpha_TRINITY_DN16472_c0_g6::TRINITY_DN16472_c0_g6_i1::g.160638::m.160638/K15175/CDC73; parafibromin
MDGGRVDPAWSSALRLLFPPALSSSSSAGTLPDPLAEGAVSDPQGLARQVLRNRPPDGAGGDVSKSRVSAQFSLGESMRPPTDNTYRRHEGSGAASKEGFFGGALRQTLGPARVNGGWMFCPRSASGDGFRFSFEERRRLKTRRKDAARLGESAPSSAGHSARLSGMPSTEQGTRVRSLVSGSHGPGEEAGPSLKRFRADVGQRLGAETRKGPKVGDVRLAEGQNEYHAKHCAALLRQMDQMPFAALVSQTQRAMQLVAAIHGSSSFGRGDRMQYNTRTGRFDPDVGAQHIRHALTTCIQLCRAKQSARQRNVAESVFRPIVMVPSGMGAVVSIFNAQRLLQLGSWEHPSEGVQRMRAKTKDFAPQTVTSVDMLPWDKTCPFPGFVLRCDPKDMKPDDWRMVCAVITDGEVWELQDYFPADANPLTQQTEPRDIFAQVQGFHFAMDDDNLPPSVQGWRLETLRVCRAQSKRHKDLAVVETFWKVLLARMVYMPQFRPFFST